MNSVVAWERGYVWSVVLSDMVITDSVARHVPCYAMVSVLVLDLKQLRHFFQLFSQKFEHNKFGFCPGCHRS